MESTLSSAATTLSHTEQKALELLSNGVPAGAVASAIGVSPSRIAQIMGDPAFAAILTEKKYESLTKHNARDSKYDKLEDMALEQLEVSLPMVMDPLKLANIASRLNAAKRRGSAAPIDTAGKTTIIQLTLPVQIVNRFSVQKNIDNQVTTIDDQSMVTVQSGQVKALAEKVRERSNVQQARAQQDVIESTRNLKTFGFEG